MASSCDVLCFKLCAFRMDLSSGDPSIHGNLHSMARCFTDVCNLDYADKNINELAKVYEMLASSANLPIYYTNCSSPIRPDCLSFDFPSYIVPAIAYLSLLLAILTVINNAFVCTVLMKTAMRNPTNAILVAIALSDTFTGLFPLPVFMHFYATERFYEWVPYNWCYPIDVFSQYLPRIFHTASIWITMGLAIQRYIIVCHPFKGKAWCTTRNVVYGTIAIYVVSILFHTTNFFSFRYVDTKVPSLLHPNQYVSACVLRASSFMEGKVDLYLSIYTWLRVLFSSLIPCVSLVVLNGLLINAMRVASIRRKQLLAQNKFGESKDLKESNHTTLLLVTVVGVFLLTELPAAMFNIVYIVWRLGASIVIDIKTWNLVKMLLYFLVLLSCPLNFYIYCCMSKRFRETFKQLFRRRVRNS